MAKYINDAKKGQRWERKLESDRPDIYGSRQPGSGNRPYAKNDLTSMDVHTEAKKTDAQKYYTLQKKDLKDVAKYALGKIPVLMLDFSGDEYAILPRKQWEALVDFCREYAEQPNGTKADSTPKGEQSVNSNAPAVQGHSSEH